MERSQDKVIRKIFENSNQHDLIRLGNKFVDDFLFEDNHIADIPINALRVIFNIISLLASDQFRPQDHPKQLSLFDQEFETDNNVFAAMKIKNTKISPSGSTKQVIDAYEFLTKFKMGWYKSTNCQGKEIRTFGGLISTPSYDQRGYTTFLISSYWLKKLMIIPEYNIVLYNLVYNIKNNKHVLFAIWLKKIPNAGTLLKLSTFNKKFGLNYKNTKDFCTKFLNPARVNLDKYNDLSFNYKQESGSIIIIPYYTKTIEDQEISIHTKENLEIKYRLNYLQKRYGLSTNDFSNFAYHYKKMPATRKLIESAYKEFISRTRSQNVKSTEYQGSGFLKQIQTIIIEFYGASKAAQSIPNGYPKIM